MTGKCLKHLPPLGMAGVAEGGQGVAGGSIESGGLAVASASIEGLKEG